MLPVCMGVTRPAGLKDVTEVRHWSYDDYTRVVVELTGASEPELHRLAANPAANRPERLYLDLPGIWVGRKYSEAISVGDGLLADVRLGQNTLQTTRVVIDLQRYGHHKVMILENPHRIVVDVFGSKKDTSRSGGPAFNGKGPRLPVGLRSVRTVIIDPGHGGRDPGAIGVGRVREKDITLRLGKKLKTQLLKRGFEVKLTRSTDKTVSLEERTAFAEGSKGDLFVSLHANAARKKSLQGIETYYLDASYRPNAARLVARENGISIKNVDALQRTLGRMRVSEASVHSSRLAHDVHDELIAGILHHYPGVHDLGVKKGPFYVLFLSNMPSILIEAGFVTHRGEAKRLMKESYLDLIAIQIADGLEDYRRGVLSVASSGGQAR